MHAVDFNETMGVINKSFKGLFTETDVLREMNVIEKSNKDHLSGHDIGEARPPSAEKLIAMERFAVEYKRCNPTITETQLRKAVQKQFNVTIFK